MAIFESALRIVRGNEGGLVDNPDDPGKITSGGISLRFLQGFDEKQCLKYGLSNPPTEQTVRDLQDAQINMIYRGEFWDKAPFEKIMNQILCNYIFDMAVNLGIEQAIKLTQRSVWACQKKKDFIKDDGVLGSFTIQAINHCSFMLLVAMQAQRDGFYRLLVAVNPAREGELNGWLNRCYRE